MKSDLELAENVVWSFEPSVVLQTLEKLYAYIHELAVYDSKCFVAVVISLVVEVYELLIYVVKNVKIKPF